MVKILAVTVTTAFMAVSAFLTPDAALAKQDRSVKGEAQECKKFSDAKAKDECVSNAKNRLEKGKSGSGGKAAKKGKSKAK